MLESSTTKAHAGAAPAPAPVPVRTVPLVQRDSLYRVLPFGAYIAFMIVADLLERSGWSVQELRWLYALRIGAVAALIWALRSAFVELHSVRTVGLRSWFAALACGVAVFVAWINLGAGWMVMGTAAGFDPGTGAGIDWPMVALRLAGSALVVPVMEELFWRSFLMRWIAGHRFLAVEPARVGIRALAVSAVFFALEHNLWLAGLVAGVVYSVLYMRSGNLWTPILAHSVTNALLGGWIVYTGSWSYW
jgi:uncharacterized protein